MSDGTPSPPAADFIEQWKSVTASELSTAQSFLIELCDLLDVARSQRPQI